MRRARLLTGCCHAPHGCELGPVRDIDVPGSISPLGIPKGSRGPDSTDRHSIPADPARPADFESHKGQGISSLGCVSGHPVVHFSDNASDVVAGRNHVPHTATSIEPGGEEAVNTNMGPPLNKEWAHAVNDLDASVRTTASGGGRSRRADGRHCRGQQPVGSLEGILVGSLDVRDGLIDLGNTHQRFHQHTSCLEQGNYENAPGKER